MPQMSMDCLGLLLAKPRGRQSMLWMKRRVPVTKHERALRIARKIARRNAGLMRRLAAR